MMSMLILHSPKLALTVALHAVQLLAVTCKHVRNTIKPEKANDFLCIAAFLESSIVHCNMSSFHVVSAV
jgi:hypothetical protein